MPTNNSDSYFQLFGLPQSFEVDPEQLERVYRQLQNSIHPDRFANASDYERRLSIQQAARINEAYGVLKDPLYRGRYLLELHGHQFNDEQSTTRNAEFLMEHMELREALAEVRDRDDPLGSLRAILDRVSNRLGESEARLRSMLKQDKSGQLAGPVEEAVDTVLQMRFYRRMQEDARDLEADLEDDLA